MSLNLPLRRRQKGEILKAERMLVRIERIDNPNANLPREFTEQSKVDSRLKREWREYYVVARAPHDEIKHVVLYIHKNRVHGIKMRELIVEDSSDYKVTDRQGCKVGNPPG